jgi:hypothetical protein
LSDSVDLPENAGRSIKRQSERSKIAARSRYNGWNEGYKTLLFTTTWFESSGWSGRLSITSAGILNDSTLGVSSGSLLIWTVALTTSSSEPEIVVCSGLICFDDNLIALTFFTLATV